MFLCMYLTKNALVLKIFLLYLSSCVLHTFRCSNSCNSFITISWILAGFSLYLSPVLKLQFFTTCCSLKDLLPSNELLYIQTNTFIVACPLKKIEKKKSEFLFKGKVYNSLWVLNSAVKRLHGDLSQIIFITIRLNIQMSKQ